MSVKTRPARLSDLDVLAKLLVQDAQQRRKADQILWPLDPKAYNKTRTFIRAAMEAENPPFRQKWILAETSGDIVGVAHTILLPVPPIYAGKDGPPGLIMEDCFVSDAAPNAAYSVLMKAAEADLIEAGAKILLASSVAGGAWETAYKSLNYEPLTLYLAKVGLNQARPCQDVRAATEKDVSAIVALSAKNRQTLAELNAFWKPHEDADARFNGWMARSLTLSDRDMFVSDVDGDVEGYCISQPATALHFPTPHSIDTTGIIDDFYHTDFVGTENLNGDSQPALSLLNAAKASRKARGDTAVLVVCPAAWTSKIQLLKAAGFDNAITWFKKRQR